MTWTLSIWSTPFLWLFLDQIDTFWFWLKWTIFLIILSCRSRSVSESYSSFKWRKFCHNTTCAKTITAREIDGKSVSQICIYLYIKYFKDGLCQNMEWIQFLRKNFIKSKYLFSTTIFLFLTILHLKGVIFLSF